MALSSAANGSLAAYLFVAKKAKIEGFAAVTVASDLFVASAIGAE